MSFDIRPLPDALGAEVIGLDVSRTLDDNTFAAVHQAHLDHLVLVFRNPCLAPQQQIDFSKRFGSLDKHPSQGDAHPAVSIRSKRGRFSTDSTICFKSKWTGKGWRHTKPWLC